MNIVTFRGALCLCLFLAIHTMHTSTLWGQCSPTAIEIPLNGVDEDCDGLDDIFLHLPPHIYTVVGQEFEFYFRNVILSTHPNDYRFTVTSPLLGTTTLEKWVCTPQVSDVGEHAFSLQVSSPSGTVLRTANCIVRVSQAGTPPNMAAKKILMWGHSFIDQGYMPYYLDSLLGNGTNPVVSFHGKRGNWVDNNKTRFEAVGGSSWLLYYNTPGSPFFYNGQLNMRAYFDEVCGLGQNPDWIVLHLDVNDYLFTGSVDGATLQAIDDYITLIYTTRTQPMMAALRAAAPNTKIAVSYTPMPNSRQSAFTNTFGAASILSNKYRWQKIVSRLLVRNTQFFGGRENENIFLLPIHLDLDDVNDYGATDPVHPVVDVANLRAQSGYREIAKSTYAWLKYMQNPSGTAPACVINTATTSQVVCNNSGTINDPSDDTFTFNLAVSATNGTGNWRTTINGQNITGAYNTPRAFGPFPIAGGVLNFNVTDQSLSTCSFAVTVTPPATCSNGVPPPSSCSGNLLQNGDFENGRNNWNGTGTAIADAASGSGAIRICGTSYDNLRQTFVGQPNTAFTLSLAAKREGAATRNPYAHVKFLTSGFGLIDVRTVEVTGTSYQAYTLNVTTPANTGWIEVALVIDSGTGCLVADDVCFAPTASQPACALIATATAITCNNNNTPSITTDDTYTFNLNVSGTNTGATGWRTNFNSQNITGTYGTARSMGPALISSGTTTLTVIDQTNSTCTTTVQVVPPAPCSIAPTCSIAATATAITCNNNNTPSITTDDTYTFNLNVSGTNTGATGWRTNFNSQNITGTYGTARSMGPALISSGTTTLTVLDQTNSTCTTTIQVVPPAPCSIAPTCSITATATAITCNNNNTPSITTDDIYTFNLNVSGTNTGATGWRTNFNSQNITGTYGAARSMGPALISSGTTTLTVIDQTNSTCATTIQVVPPAPCSIAPTCSITATATAITCNNNNTPSITTDDTYTFNLNVSGTNTGATGWRTTFNSQNITGTYGTARSMGPALISSGTATLTVIDQTNSTCTTTVQVVPPAPCSTPPSCSITATATAITCNNNNTPSITTDDTYTFNLNVSGTNTGATGWRTTFNSQNITGTYGTARSMGPALISSGTATLTVIDQTNSTCTTTVQVVPPAPCSIAPSCSITATATAITCNNNNTPSITTDDTYTFNLNVSGTNTSTSGWRTIFNNQTVTGSYTASRSMGPALISTGTVTFTVTDQTNSGCTTTVQVVPPAPCSVPPTSTCSGNLLNNPGFEQNLNSWDGSSATIVTAAASGANAARLCGTNFTTLRQTIQAQAGTTYNLQATARKETPAASRNPVLQIKFMNSAWSPLQVRSIEITSSSYTTSLVSLAAPAGTAWVESQVYVDGSTGCVFVDDFCLTTGTVGAPGPVAYCTAAATSPWEDWISSVKVNATTRTSGKSPYSDHTSTEFALNRTGNNTIEISTSFSYFTYDEYWKVWIDYNKNGVFEEPTELILQTISAKPADGLNATKTLVGSFTLPTNAPTGTTRMRVSMSRGAYVGPCQNPANGEVEDYTVLLGTTLQNSKPDTDFTPSTPLEVFTLYPNPASSELWLALGSHAPGTQAEVTIFTPSANIAYRQRFNAHVSDAIRLDLSELHTGLYFVSVVMEGQRPVVKKVMVVKE